MDKICWALSRSASLTYAISRGVPQEQKHASISMTRGNMIGAPLHVRLSINSGTFSDNTDLMDTAYYSICAVIKLLGCEIAENAVKIIQDTSGKTVFALLTINYASQTAIIELGNVSGIDNGMKIIGTEGCIEVPANWWQVGYFKMLMARTSL